MFCCCFLGTRHSEIVGLANQVWATPRGQRNRINNRIFIRVWCWGACNVQSIYFRGRSVGIWDQSPIITDKESPLNSSTAEMTEAYSVVMLVQRAPLSSEKWGEFTNPFFWTWTFHEILPDTARKKQHLVGIQRAGKRGLDRWADISAKSGTPPLP